MSNDQQAKEREKIAQMESPEAKQVREVMEGGKYLYKEIKRVKWLMWVTFAILVVFCLPYILDHLSKIVISSRRFLTSFGEDLPKDNPKK